MRSTLLSLMCSALYITHTVASGAGASANEDQVAESKLSFSSLAETSAYLEEDYKSLICAAREKNWESVDLILPKLSVEWLNEQQRKVIDAIGRLKPTSTEKEDELRTHTQTLERAFLLLGRSAPIEFPHARLEEYIAESSIFTTLRGGEKEEARQAMREALSEQIAANGEKWPGKDQLDIAEQFFWNMIKDNENETWDFKNNIRVLFKQKITQSWDDFAAFCVPYRLPTKASLWELRELFIFYTAFSNPTEKQAFFDFIAPYEDFQEIRKISALLPTYKAFPDLANRRLFLDFCESYRDAENPRIYPITIGRLLPIYQAFSDPVEMSAFMTFCEPYTDGEEGFSKLEIISNLLPIYKTFTDPAKREEFLNFCKPCLDKSNKNCMIYYMSHELLPIYQTFSNKEALQDFINFCQFVSKDEENNLGILSSHFPVYTAFSNQEQRQAFLDFCSPSIEGIAPDRIVSILKSLLPIYQGIEDPQERQAFLDFCQSYQQRVEEHNKLAIMDKFFMIYQADRLEDYKQFLMHHSHPEIKNSIFYDLVTAYQANRHLRYMRLDGALKAETAPSTQRVRSMYETDAIRPLPILWHQDLFRMRGHIIAGGAVNAHDFEPIYELERLILWGQTQECTLPLSPDTHTICNNGEIAEGHRTNTEVQDFIEYLDHVIAEGGPLRLDSQVISGPKIVSIIKQMLGLERKAIGTTGTFAPYLSSSMYYAQPDAPKGDEMLGRVWFYMKSLSGTSADTEDYKKSVVLALLEASEISSTSISTHCQTRITGELMKLVAWHLPESKLRPLIATNDLPEVQTDLPEVHEEQMQNRIATAPLRAQQLFRIMKREDAGEIRKLIQCHLDLGTEPQLWERYEAYYDDLYRRTKNEDGHGYKADEHILNRDAQGNLVRLYDVDGALLAVPQVVYYQTEFQVFEKTFTELMQKEFEQQRAVKYSLL